MELQPISYEGACAFIEQHHLQPVPSNGWKFGIAVQDGERTVGVITIGRPVIRYKDDGRTLEVTACCFDGTKDVRSMLLEAALKAIKAMGYKRLMMYTAVTESGLVDEAEPLQEPSKGIGSKEQSTLNSIVRFPNKMEASRSDMENLRFQLETAKRVFQKQGYFDWVAEITDALEKLKQKDLSFIDALWLKFAPTCDIDDLVIIAPELHNPPLTAEQADDLNGELFDVANATFSAIERVKDAIAEHWSFRKALT